METAWSFPFVGLVVGAGAAIILWLAIAVGLPAPVAALLAITASVALTGALHEDGLADVADGFGGGHDAEGKIAIMRDSRIGTYGVIALVTITGLKVAAITSLVESGELIVPALSFVVAHSGGRALMVFIAGWLNPATDTGIGHTAGRPSTRTVWSSLAIALVLCLLLLPITGFIASVFAGVIATTALGVLAQRQIGGYTGDVLGATEQVAETAILLALAATAAGSE